MEATQQATLSPSIIRIHPDDNVAVAIRDVPAGTAWEGDGDALTLQDDLPAGHKVALRPIARGEKIRKYGHVIGHATEDIAPGVWVHSHNLATDLEGALAYRYDPDPEVVRPEGGEVPTFRGYRRASGRVGTRNEIWVLNTVGCVNTTAEMVARMARAELEGSHVDGVHSFSHPYGCSQLGDDLVNTRRVMAGLLRHPNAGGVLVLGLGCENNQMKDLLREAGDVDRDRIRFYNAQEVGDEIEVGLEAVRELAENMEGDRREPCPLSDLVLGLKCGGSDGFSGISANPLVGRIADRLTRYGGTAVQTEVPEMFGAEQQLMNRARDEDTFHQVVDLINGFKQYFLDHDQPVYENPSPGNKRGGLTTLEEKSLGATQKGGRAVVQQVLGYGDPVRAEGGLALVYAPGNDAVSSTAMTVSGAALLLFTTGRGTPLGFPVPTLKISSNTPIYERKERWIDFNAGALLDGTATMDELEEQLLDLVIRVASGEPARNEVNGYREIAIWKQGVTL